MTLRERAHEALVTLRVKEAEERAKDASKAEKQIRERFEKDFGMAPETVNGETRTVTHEGLVLHCGSYYYQLKGRCPECGEECESVEIENLVELGAQIEAFEPHWSHHCAEDEEVENAVSRLVRAFSDLLHEVEH